MIKRFMGIVMTKFPTLNGDQISEDLMKDILEHQPSVPVTVDFNHRSIGKSVQFSKTDLGLLCEIEVDESYTPLISHKFLVPQLDDVHWHYEGRVKVVDSGVLSHLSITFLPADMHLDPIFLKGENNESD